MFGWGKNKIVLSAVIAILAVLMLTGCGGKDDGKTKITLVQYKPEAVPGDVYEAAAIDGATGWILFKEITFPLILPFFSINMVLCVKNFLMVFDQIMALTKGGPAQSTESISYLIYSN